MQGALALDVQPTEHWSVGTHSQDTASPVIASEVVLHSSGTEQPASSADLHMHVQLAPCFCPAGHSFLQTQSHTVESHLNFEGGGNQAFGSTSGGLTDAHILPPSSA